MYNLMYSTSRKWIMSRLRHGLSLITEYIGLLLISLSGRVTGVTVALPNASQQRPAGQQMLKVKQWNWATQYGIAEFRSTFQVSSAVRCNSKRTDDAPWHICDVTYYYGALHHPVARVSSSSWLWWRNGSSGIARADSCFDQVDHFGKFKSLATQF